METVLEPQINEATQQAAQQVLNSQDSDGVSLWIKILCRIMGVIGAILLTIGGFTDLFNLVVLNFSGVLQGVLMLLLAFMLILFEATILKI